MLSVTLATDQSSNGCYNCIRQAGPYQPAVKMQTNICSMQIPYSGVVLVLIHYTPSVFFCNFCSSIQLTFFRILIQKRFVLWSNTLSQSFQWYPVICHFIFEEIFSQSKNFYENNDIMVLSDMAKSGLESAWCMDWWILSSIILASLRLEHYARYDSQNKDNPLPWRKIRRKKEKYVGSYRS